MLGPPATIKPITTSSSELTKANSAPARTDIFTWGRTTSTIACSRDAPQLRAAFSRLRSKSAQASHHRGDHERDRQRHVRQHHARERVDQAQLDVKKNTPIASRMTGISSRCQQEAEQGIPLAVPEFVDAVGLQSRSASR